MFECKTFISVREIKEMLCVSESKAYSIVRDLNKELEDKGYLIIVNTDESVHTARSSSACFPVFQCTLSAT